MDRLKALERWEAYQQTEEYISHDDMVDYLESWGEVKRLMFPDCATLHPGYGTKTAT